MIKRTKPLKRSWLKKSPTPIKRGALPKPKCQCGHGANQHLAFTGVYAQVCTVSTCECQGYRPKGLKRSTTPIKAKKADPKKRRGAKRVNEGFREFIRTHPCYLLNKQFKFGDATMLHMCQPMSDVEATHIKSKGAGGSDQENLLPLCGTAHRYQHNKGLVSWAAQYGLTVDDLKAEAQRLWAEYENRKAL